MSADRRTPRNPSLAQPQGVERWLQWRAMRSPCPGCGSPGVHVLYGRLTVVGRRAVDAGDVHPGGCIASPGSPLWRCTACGHRWGRRDSDPMYPRPG